MGQPSKSPKSSNNKQFTIKDSIKYRKYYQTFVLGSGAFLIAFLISSVFSPVQNSDAAQLVEITNDATGWYITVDGSSTVGINVESTPAGQLASAKDTINVKTNSPFGYHLLVNTETANIYNSSDTGKTGPHFSPASGSLFVPAALTKDTWGFSLDEQSTPIPDGASVWSAVPTTATEIKQEQSANIPSGTDLDIYYAVNASTNLTGGSYTATIVYTAYSEGVTSDIPYMQDFTQAQCNALKVDTPTRLMDARDQKIYNVTKLKDGNCWMTSNLALDGGRTLTPSDSNVVQNRTLPSNIENGTPSSNTVSQIFSGVADQTTTKCNDSYPYCVENNTKYGNLYNWMAATAGTGTASAATTIYESVCPRGWRLPDNGGNGVDKSYGNLLAKYGAGNGENVDASETGGDYVRTAQKAPLFFALAGYYNDVSYDQGRAASHWSRTPASDTSATAYRLYLNSQDGRFYLQNPSRKAYGFSVRCVYGENTENLMQNFTAAMCNNLSVSTASADNRKILMDSRDGKLYNISRLADNPAGTNNGTCWMVSNLALDGADSQGNVRTLTPSDSNVTQNHTLAANVSGSVAAEYDKVQINSSIATKTTTVSNNGIVASNSPYGNFYNWNAATAGVGLEETTETVYESVCPKGWRLPDNGAEGVDKSYGNLIAKVIGGNGTNTNSMSWVISSQGAPLYVALAGYAQGSSLVYTGVDSTLYSRTVGINYPKGAYYMNIDAYSGNLFPQYNDGHFKDVSFGVRCVTE